MLQLVGLRVSHIDAAGDQRLRAGGFRAVYDQTYLLGRDVRNGAVAVSPAAVADENAVTAPEAENLRMRCVFSVKRQKASAHIVRRNKKLRQPPRPPSLVYIQLVLYQISGRSASKKVMEHPAKKK